MKQHLITSTNMREFFFLGKFYISKITKNDEKFVTVINAFSKINGCIITIAYD